MSGLFQSSNDLPTKRTSLVQVRVTPAELEVLRIAAAAEGRTVANLVRLVLRDFIDNSQVPRPTRAARALSKKRGRRA